MTNQRTLETIVSHLNVALNKFGVVSVEAQVNGSLTDYVRVTQADPSKKMVAHLTHTHYKQLLWALRRIPFENFVINGEPYRPGLLEIQLYVNNKMGMRRMIKGLDVGDREGIYFYHPREEWYCNIHAARFKKIGVAFSPREMQCVRCIEEEQSLKRRYRSVCSGCRNDYYNHEQNGSKGVRIQGHYACWHLREIERGKCRFKSR